MGGCGGGLNVGKFVTVLVVHVGRFVDGRDVCVMRTLVGG